MIKFIYFTVTKYYIIQSLYLFVIKKKGTYEISKCHVYRVLLDKNFTFRTETYTRG